MVVKGTIKVSTHGIGTVALDPTTIKTEGGAPAPRLTIPLVIAMYPRPVEEQLAIMRLSAALHLRGDMSAPFVETRMEEDFSCRSLNYVYEHHVNVSFSLTPQKAAHLDRCYHEGDASHPMFTLALSGPVVWLYQTGNTYDAEGRRSPVDSPWPNSMGLWSQIAWFWESRWDSLGFSIPVETWTTQVLPGWGLDRYRLLELRFPNIVDSNGETITRQWDRALDAYRHGRYSDAIGHLRGILNTVNKEFGASKGTPLASIVGHGRHWSEDDSRRKLLDEVWKGLTIITNKEIHPEDGVTHEWSVNDCRWLFLMVTSTLEYLGAKAR